MEEQPEYAPQLTQIERAKAEFKEQEQAIDAVIAEQYEDATSWILSMEDSLSLDDKPNEAKSSSDPGNGYMKGNIM